MAPTNHKPMGDARTSSLRFYLDRLDRIGPISAKLILAGLLSGCTSPKEWIHNNFKVGPNYQKPPAAIAEKWIDSNDKRVRSETEDISQWWTAFNDPMLAAIIENVYKQNLTLRSAGFRILEARANLGINVGEFFPQTQNLQGGYLREAISRNVANREYIQQPYFQDWNFSMNMAWELDFWGRFRRAIETADAQLDESVENYDDVLVTLIGEAAQSYVLLRTFEQRIAYAKANAEIQRTTLNIATARFNAGATSELDVDQAESDLAETLASIPELETFRRRSNNRLCVLLGIPTRDLHPEVGNAPIPNPPPEVALGIPADLLARKPKVRKAERAVAAQSAQIGVAVAELYPHISITGTLGVESTPFQNLFNNRATQGTIGPTFTWNVLNYGRLRNNIRLQDATLQQLIADYQETVLEANEEVETALALFLFSQLRTKEMQDAVNASIAAVNTAIAQYRDGLVDFNRVAVIQEKLVGQQDKLAQAQGDIALGLVLVYRALGGGWEIRLDPNSNTPATGPGTLCLVEVVGAPGAPAPLGDAEAAKVPLLPGGQIPPANNFRANPPAPAAPMPAKPGEISPAKVPLLPTAPPKPATSLKPAVLAPQANKPPEVDAEIQQVEYVEPAAPPAIQKLEK